jgi:UPF0271 protein
MVVLMATALGVIDINSDVGESFGAWRMGYDAHTLASVTSANIACGLHAGDPVTMRDTVRTAARLNVSCGAHPGYPDLVGFGRRDMAISPDEAAADLAYQVGALWAITRAEGVQLRHVKPHGALYNRAARDRALALALAHAVRSLDLGLVLVGLAGSAMEQAAHEAGIAFAGEAFADRAYNSDGSLVSRSRPGAVIEDPALVAGRAVSIARDGSIETYDGGRISLGAHTICVHGDTRQAAETARAVREAITAAGIRIEPLWKIVS